jgi:hypothetical protein
MFFLLLFFDMNNIYTFSGWWYFWALIIDAIGVTFIGSTRD